MKKRLLFLLSMGLVAIVGVALLSLHQYSVEAKKTTHPLTEINQKAKSVRNGNSADAEAYVGEILKVASFEGEVPGFTAAAGETIAERVASAEVSYRQGKSAGVREEQMARTMNDLVNELRLPNYTKTSVSEIRRLRFMLLPNFPEIIGRGADAGTPLKVGSKYESEMAPAEAVFVMMMMFQQKLYNPEYQLTHSERRSLWNDIYNHHPDQQLSDKLPTGRGAELRGALHQTGESLAASDVLSLSDATLDALGIEGGDKK